MPEEECGWLARELGERALFAFLDVTNQQQWDAVVHAAEEAFGLVSVLVNNAEITGLGTISGIDPLGRARADQGGRPLELGRDHIRVSSVHPGFVPTSIADVGPGGVSLTSARLVANPAVTRLVLFLASSGASFSTGAEFLVDGGLLLGPVFPHGPGATFAT